MTSIIDKLKKISSGNNGLDSAISKFILQNYEENILLKGKILSKKLNISESTLTIFSKRLGYEGYLELYYRLVIEKEYYGTNEISQDEVTYNNLEHINQFSNVIAKADDIYILNSPENVHVQLDFLTYFLVRKNKNVFYSNRRKLEKRYIETINNKSVILVFMNGLEIQELRNLVSNYAVKKPTFLFVTSSPYFEEALKICEFENVIKLKNIVGHNSVIRQVIRSNELNDIILHLLKALSKSLYN